MHGVEGLLGAASSRLLDAGELEHVLEHVLVILDTFPLVDEGASLFSVALESLIQNTPYSGVVLLLLLLTRRVKIRCYRVLCANDDECAVFVSAQHD